MGGGSWGGGELATQRSIDKHPSKYTGNTVAQNTLLCYTPGHIASTFSCLEWGVVMGFIYDFSD